MEITFTPLSSCKVTKLVQSSTKVMKVPTAMLQPLYPSITIFHHHQVLPSYVGSPIWGLACVLAP
eukprot:2685935-Prymnesium_polylepis.1